MKAQFSNFLIFSLVIFSGAIPAHADDFAKFKKLLEAPVSTYLDQQPNLNPIIRKPSFFKSNTFQDSINRAFCPSSSLGNGSSFQGRIDLPQSEEILAAIKGADKPYLNPDKFGPPKELVERMSSEIDSDAKPEDDFSLGHSIVEEYHQQRFSLPPMAGGSSSGIRHDYETSADPSEWQDRDNIRIKAKQTIADYFTHVPIFGSKIWTGSYSPPDPRHKHKHFYLGINGQF